MSKSYGDNKKKQTRDMMSFVRNMAVFFVLAIWTLGDCVAPERKLLVTAKGNYADDDYEDGNNDGKNDNDGWIAPDRPHREELASGVADVQEGAFAGNTMVLFEDSLLLVLFLTHFFVFSIFTLGIIVTLELLIHTNFLPGKSSISCRAHQQFTITVSTSWRLEGLVTILPVTPRSYLLIAVGLIFAIIAMTHLVTLVLLLNANLLERPLPSPRLAHQLLSITV